ncbi:transketolase, partial [Francisella tularensis subsp. holarctica]|nr:transketolase [Francisella tularensis subsp. holarctica]
SVWRPADTIETMRAWKEAVKSKDTPSVMVLTRQNLRPVVQTQHQVANIARGGYLVKDNTDAKLTIVATGSEVEIAVKVA